MTSPRFTARWSPGDRLLLYTDVLVESRDQHGDLLPQDQIATALAAADCDRALDTLLTAVHRHTGGRGHDDMALLLLENGASPGGVKGHPAAPTAATAVAAPRCAAMSHEPARADLARMSPESELIVPESLMSEMIAAEKYTEENSSRPIQNSAVSMAARMRRRQGTCPASRKCIVHHKKAAVPA